MTPSEPRSPVVGTLPLWSPAVLPWGCRPSWCPESSIIGALLISRPLRFAAQGAAALTVAAGSFGVAHLDKAVALSVDGKSSSLHVFGSTVGDALAKKGIKVGEHDQVVPSVGSPLEDGDTISVRYGRKLTVTIDGVKKDYWTTATTVDAALRDLNIRAGSDAKLSASRSQTLGRQGLALTVTTPKPVLGQDRRHVQGLHE